jgi:site-specific DNA recombinase
LDEECNSVIVYKLDRLMRNFSQGVVFIKFLLDNDVKIISVTEDVNSSTTSGRFFINMLLSLSELERDTIVDRLKSGKRKNFLNQKRSCGRISFGYKKVDDTLVVDENESKIVRYIFKKYSEYLKQDMTKTKRTQRLLKLLKKNNFKYRNREFKSYHIHQILSNEFYVGVLKNKDERTVHSYDTIVSKRLFNLVR